MPDKKQRTHDAGSTRRTDETNRGDPRAVRPMDDVGMASGSVDDAQGAAGNLAGGEGDAYPKGPGAESGMLQGAMTNPEVPEASMGYDEDQVLGGGTMSAADTPMPATKAGAEVEKRGIAREPMDEQSGGESHA